MLAWDEWLSLLKSSVSRSHHCPEGSAGVYIHLYLRRAESIRDDVADFS